MAYGLFSPSYVKGRQAMKFTATTIADAASSWLTSSACETQR